MTEEEHGGRRCFSAVRTVLEGWDRQKDKRESWRTTSLVLEHKLADGTLELMTRESQTERLSQVAAPCNTFHFESWLLWQDRGGQSRGNTKIASSDLSFINFSTPAAIRWNRLLAGEETQHWALRWSVESQLHFKLWTKHGEKHMGGMADELQDGITRRSLRSTTLSGSIHLSRPAAHAWTGRCIQGVVSLLSATWQKSKYSPWRHCFMFTCSQD